MPSRLNSPILAVDMNRVAGLDPSNVDNLYSMWTIFSKCAASLENGRRLENLSWRLWNRETFCCDNDTPAAAAAPTTATTATAPETETETETETIPIRKLERQESEPVDIPELSSSVVSAPSDDELPDQRSRAVGIKRPCLVRSDSSRGREKRMTPVHLARIMEDMSMSNSSTEDWKAQSARMRRKASSMPTERVPAAMAAMSKSCDDSTEVKSTPSAVRGFSPSRISSSYRSSASIAASALPAQTATPAPAQKKKQPLFFFASSPSSDGSPDQSYCSFKQGNDKRTSFRDEVSTRTLYHDDDDDDSDDDEVSESAIDDDDLEWESSSESGSSSYDDNALFKRVESRPSLIASRRSLLSTMLHEPDRAAQLASVASKSTPVLRRCSNLPREPLLGSTAAHDDEVPGSKPIRRINTALHPLALSPRTTRRNMLATELTESLRKHLLWERQQKNTTASAHLKRRHTAADVTKLADYPQPRGKGRTSKNNSWNNPFDETQYEYHAAGW